MDENKRKLNQEEGGNIIDLGAARAERERQEREAEKRRVKAERPPMWRRVLSLVLILALVLAAVLLTVYWDKINFDAVRRTFSYMGTEQDETGETEPFEYARGSENCFAALGKNLVFVSNKEVVVYDYDGGTLYQRDLQLETPMLDVGTAMAAAYDIGGSNLLVFNEKGEKMNLTLDSGLGIYSASFNDADWLAVTAQKKSQKGCVMVYNSNMEKVFEFDSASRFVIGAYVTEDCKYMVAETLGQTDGTFVSQMVVYKLDSEEQYAAFDVADAMVLSVDSVSGQTVCIADNQTVFASVDGQVSAAYSYPLPYLREYSADGDGYVTLVLNRYRAGANGQLVTLNSGGEVMAQTDISEEILDLSAAGRYIAVLYADRLVIYNKDLTEYGTFSEIGTTQSVCMCADGSVWLISEDEIGLLIP